MTACTHRWRIDEFKREMLRVGVDLPLNPCGQGFKDMSPRVEATQEALLNGRMRHGANAVLTYAAAASTVTTDQAGNRKIDKSRAGGRIDPLVAMVMAVGELRRGVEAYSTSPMLVWGGSRDVQA